jgi:hypothetical protein
LIKHSYGLQPSFFTSWADTQAGAGKPDYDDFKFSDLVLYDGFAFLFAATKQNTTVPDPGKPFR